MLGAGFWDLTLEFGVFGVALGKESRFCLGFRALGSMVLGRFRVLGFSVAWMFGVSRVVWLIPSVQIGFSSLQIGLLLGTCLYLR